MKRYILLSVAAVAIAVGSFIGGVYYAIGVMNDDVTTVMNACIAEKLEIDQVVTVVECFNNMEQYTRPHGGNNR